MSFTEWFRLLVGMEWKDYQNYYSSTYGHTAFTNKCEELKKEYLRFCEERNNEIIFDW